MPLQTMLDKGLQNGGMSVLRLAPWVVFGPITGLFSEWALHALSRGQRRKAAAIVALNMVVVGSIPLLTLIIAKYRLMS